jgi:cyclin-dependent kinase 12/13
MDRTSKHSKKRSKKSSKKSKKKRYSSSDQDSSSDDLRSSSKQKNSGNHPITEYLSDVSSDDFSAPEAGEIESEGELSTNAEASGNRKANEYDNKAAFGGAKSNEYQNNKNRLMVRTSNTPRDSQAVLAGSPISSSHSSMSRSKRHDYEFEQMDEEMDDLNSDDDVSERKRKKSKKDKKHKKNKKSKKKKRKRQKSISSIETISDNEDPLLEGEPLTPPLKNEAAGSSDFTPISPGKHYTKNIVGLSLKYQLKFKSYPTSKPILIQSVSAATPPLTFTKNTNSPYSDSRRTPPQRPSSSARKFYVSSPHTPPIGKKPYHSPIDVDAPRHQDLDRESSRKSMSPS